jgi:DNA-binding CsgD family transcriptional regulator
VNTDLERNLTLRGEDELLAHIDWLLSSLEHEFICASSDLGTWSILTAKAQRAVARGWRPPPGLRIQELFAPEVLVDAECERLLLEATTEYGAEVRICATAPAHETIILDRRIAILAGPPAGGVRVYTVVRSPDVINGVLSLFWAVWAGATELTEHLRARDTARLRGARRNPGTRGTPVGPAAKVPELDESSLRILRLLSDGLKDETAARRLGMSLRTYRRRVAQLMVVLGAETRFQAGRRVRELGLDE